MSWCRWGSPCSFSMPQYECDTHCADCPGSDLYIYEADENQIVCCACRLHPEEEDFISDEKGMLNHIEEHVVTGHHVRPSLRRNAERVLAEPWKSLVEEIRSAGSAQDEPAAGSPELTPGAQPK